jgi:hypothetical protein
MNKQAFPRRSSTRAIRPADLCNALAARAEAFVAAGSPAAFAMGGGRPQRRR